MRRSDQLRPQAQLDLPDQRGQSVQRGQSAPLLQSHHSVLPNPLGQLDLPDRLNPQVQMGQSNPLRQLYRSVPSLDDVYLLNAR